MIHTGYLAGFSVGVFMLGFVAGVVLSPVFKVWCDKLPELVYSLCDKLRS